MNAIEQGSGNVYADLGLFDAESMLVKARFAVKIGEIIEARRWTKQRASEVLGVSESYLSRLLIGQFRDLQEADMATLLKRAEASPAPPNSDTTPAPQKSMARSPSTTSPYSPAPRASAWKSSRHRRDDG
jgi:predicted XRE-type DNA-binding protein